MTKPYPAMPPTMAGSFRPDRFAKRLRAGRRATGGGVGQELLFLDPEAIMHLHIDPLLRSGDGG